jgi:hypothetical protein
MVTLPFTFNFLLSYYSCIGAILWHLQYILVKFTLSFLFIPPYPILRIVSTGFIFLFSCMSTWYFYHISYILPPPTGSNSQTRPVLPSCFAFGRKETFLFKIAKQRVPFWYSHVYMYVSQIGSSPSIFLLSTLVLLWWFQHIHSCIESVSPIFTFFTSFLSFVV